MSSQKYCVAQHQSDRTAQKRSVVAAWTKKTYVRRAHYIDPVE